MSKSRNRRDFLTTVGAAVALPIVATRALAQAKDEPKKTAGLEYRTAEALAAALVARQISAVELTDHLIARIEARDGRINAVVVRDFERARAAAARADEALAPGERRPLLGVPMTVKESFNVAGLPTTWGIPAGQGLAATEDALIVARAEGGRRHRARQDQRADRARRLAELQRRSTASRATRGTSSARRAARRAARRRRWRPASCPWSSAPTSAARCACRRTSAACWRSSRPRAGAQAAAKRPRAAGRCRGNVDLVVVGPMARTAADLELAAGRHRRPRRTDHRHRLPARVAAAAARAAAGFRVLMLDSHPLVPTAGPVRAALERLAGRLAPAASRSAQPPAAARSRRGGAAVHAAAVSFSAGRQADGALRAHPGTRGASGRRNEPVAATRLRGIVLSHRDWVRPNRHSHRASRSNGATSFARSTSWSARPCRCRLSPRPHTAAARRIQIDDKDYPYDDQVVWPGVATLPGLPATAVPIERTDTGLPIGVQIIGPYLEDRTPLAFAKLIEREFGGFVPPPGLAG